MAEKLVGSALGYLAGEAASAIGHGLVRGAKYTGKTGFSFIKGVGRESVSAGKSAYNTGKNVTLSIGEQILDKGNRTYAKAYAGKVSENIANLTTRRTGTVNPYKIQWQGGQGKTVEKSLDEMSSEMYRDMTARNKMTGEKIFKGQRGLELTGVGTAAIAGAFLYRGTKDMDNQIKAENMGQVDSQKTTSTPTFDGYISTNRAPIGPLSGGADGSLVFALHNNR